MVHHLKFHMVTGGSMSAGGTVSYGHGSNLSDFGGDYGYRDMMMGDIHSSVVNIGDGDNNELSAAITKTNVNVKLPAGVEGATYRVINTNPDGSSAITVSTTETGTDDDGNVVPLQSFTLNAQGHSRYTYIGNKWYEQF